MVVRLSDILPVLGLGWTSSHSQDNCSSFPSSRRVLFSLWFGNNEPYFTEPSSSSGFDWLGCRGGLAQSNLFTRHFFFRVIADRLYCSARHSLPDLHRDDWVTLNSCVDVAFWQGIIFFLIGSSRRLAVNVSFPHRRRFESPSLTAGENRCASRDWLITGSIKHSHSSKTFPRRGRPPCLTDNGNWDVFLCGAILKIAAHMANTRRAWFRALSLWKCVAPGIGGPGQLQQRGPHRGADQRPTGPRDRPGEAGAAAPGGRQRLHSAVLFCFTPHTHAQLPFDCLLNYVQSNN